MSDIPSKFSNKRPLWVRGSCCVILAAFLELLIVFRGNPCNLSVLWNGVGAPDDVQGKFDLWIVVILTQAGLWGLCGIVLIERIYKEWEDGLFLKAIAKNSAILFALTVLAGVVVVSPFFGPRQYSFGEYGPYLNMHGMSALGFVVSGIAVAGILATWGKIAINDHIDVTSFVKLRKQLDGFLLIVSIVLVLGTISVALTQRLLTAIRVTNSFPREVVMIFGGVYSALLGMVYAPVYIEFQRVGESIRDALLEPDWSGTTLPQVEGRARHEDRLDKILRLQIGDWASLGPGFAIFGPFLISVITTWATGK